MNLTFCYNICYILSCTSQCLGSTFCVLGALHSYRNKLFNSSVDTIIISLHKNYNLEKLIFLRSHNWDLGFGTQVIWS